MLNRIKKKPEISMLLNAELMTLLLLKFDFKLLLIICQILIQGRSVMRFLLDLALSLRLFSYHSFDSVSITKIS